MDGYEGEFCIIFFAYKLVVGIFKRANLLTKTLWIAQNRCCYRWLGLVAMVALKAEGVFMIRVEFWFTSRDLCG